MSRDSILDEAEQRNQNSDPESESGAAGATSTEDDADGESAHRAQFTQRCPGDLLANIERIQDKLGLPSRNATINFLLKRAADDFLEDDQ